MGQSVSELWTTLWNMSDTQKEYAFEINGVWYGSDHEVDHDGDSAIFEDFGIGNAYIASLALGLYADDVPEGAEIRRYVRLVNGNQVSEWIPKGVFYARERKPDDGYWTVSAMDAMRKADIVWEPDQSLEFPMPMDAAVAEFARIMGVELDERNEISSEYTIGYPANNMTIRNELETIAAAHGENFIISEVGKLRMLPLISVPKETSHLVNERGAAILIGGVAILVGDATVSNVGQSVSEKYFVGSDLIAFSDNGKYKPVSRVTLAVDDINVITAGDDTGMELYAFCPHATQEMVDALLEKLRGYTYQAFEAEEANLNPSAELGDGVTVGGVYGVISKLRDDGSGYVGISAPGKAELEDGYPTEGPMSQMINRQLAGVRSAITKTSEEIRLEVANDIEGLSSSVDIELGKIRQEVQGAEEAISYLEVDLEAISGRVQDAEGNIGALELEAANFGVRLEDAEGNIAKLELSTEEIEASVGKVSVRISDLEGLTITDENGKTEIDGSRIASNSIYGNSIHLGGLLTVYDGEYSDDIGGFLGYDSGFYGNTSGIGLRDAYENSEMVCTEWAARMSYSDDLGEHITQVVCGQELALSSVGSIQFSIGGDVDNVVAGLDGYSFYPADLSMTLGEELLPWADVYAAGTSMSALKQQVDDLASPSGTTGTLVNSSIDAKLKNYSTTAQMNMAIATAVDGLTSEEDVQTLINAAVVNENLLHNWYFANCVNQRGQTAYTASGYTIDCWAKASSGAVTVADGYVTVGSGTTLQDRQEADAVSAITGRELTFSVLTDTGLVAGTAIFTSAQIFYSDDKIALRISGAGNPYIVTTADVNIIAVKLELGSVQTLAHQDSDGNWVLNETPDFAEELAKCQRYYQLFSSADKRPAALADYRPAMRAAPATGTITVGGVTYYYADASL